MSSDADRSSYRYTKDIVADDYLRIIQAHVDFQQVEQFIDIGSNRGSFIRWIQSQHPQIECTGIESDPTVVDSYVGLKNVSVQACRFEHAELPNEHFDFAHCIHTLEHAASATEMFRGIRDSLKLGALFFLAVPNTLFFEDLIEELFIDPHTYHFNYHLLLEFVQQNGFSIEYASAENYKDIILVLRKNPAPTANQSFQVKAPQLATQTLAALQHYQSNILENRGNLIRSTQQIEAAAKEYKVVIWGAGRILDALVEFGKLDLDCIHTVVDKHLSAYVSEIYNRPLAHPDQLTEESTENILVYIASRNYAAEIQEQAEQLGLKHFMHFSPPK